jgi:TonB-dependent receptor
MQSMNKGNPSRRALARAIAALVAAPGLAVAQSGTIEEVVVQASPIRDSQQAALDAKRNANNFVDIVSADTIGRFPDQNLADSLGRLPGVAIERDQGQARYLNLRGAPFRWTGIAFDGIDVPGAENGRIPRFDSFPAVITSRLEANKAILPSMPGESVSGFINVHTFNPFDVEGLSVFGDFGMGEQDLGGGDVTKRALRLSWSDERFGAVVYASENSRDQITDNREYDLALADNGDLVVNELDLRSYFVDRKDSAYGGRLEYRGTGALTSVFASTLYTEFVDDEQRNQFVFEVLDPQPGVQRENVPVLASRWLQEGRYENSTHTSTLGADFALAGWQLEARANYTETDFDVRLPIPLSTGAVTQAAIDVRDREDPLLTLAQPLDSLAYPVTLGIDFGSQLQIDATKFKLDARRGIAVAGRDTELGLGLQLDRRESTGFALNQAITPISGVDIDSFNLGTPWESNTTNSIGATYYDNTGVRNAWAAAGGIGPVQPTADQLVAIDEDILAAYLMATTDFNWGNVVYGLRMEYTDYTSSGLAGEQPITVDDDFVNWLPSVHVNIDLAEDVKLRLSGSTGVNRPTYNEWRAAANVNIPDQQVTGGNPFLKAEEAMGVDLSLEWYFASASLLSLGAFHREIDNVIYADVSTVDGGNYLPGAEGQAWRLSGATNGDDGRLTGVEANFMISAADFLPAPFDGLGLSTNLTLLDSEFKTLDGRALGLPGTSDLIYNASVFYETAGLSLRLNYQYRDEWISPIEDPSEIWGEIERVDATVLYDLPFDVGGAVVSLYANANNLTDETDVRFAGNGTINQSESFGPHYTVGVRVNY